MRYFDTDRVIFIINQENIIEVDFSPLPQEDEQMLIQTIPIHILEESAEETW